MKVRIKRLHPDAKIPSYATVGSAGFDLVSVEDAEIGPGECKLVKTGFSIEVPMGFELQVRPRSGNSLKTHLRVANSPGTVDSDYRGEMCVLAWNASAKEYDGVGKTTYGMVSIKKGDRIAQGVICPIVQAEFEEVEELSSTDRGSGGFGSTGK